MNDKTTVAQDETEATGEDPRIAEAEARRERKNRLERERAARKRMSTAAAVIEERAVENVTAFKAAATTGEDVRRASICIIIDSGRLGVRRSVSSADIKVAAKQQSGDEPDQDMLAVAKDLLDSDELRLVVLHDHYTKQWVRSRSVPSPLLRHGAFLLSARGLEETYEYLERRLAERKDLVRKFAARYPALITEARKRLGPLFDAGQYPPIEAITSKFYFTWSLVEMGTPDQKLRAVSAALYERERAKAETKWENAVGQINEALAAGMRKVVAHFADQLSGESEGGKKKRVTAAAMKHVTEFLDNFDKRNLTNNVELQRLVDDARRVLSGVDVKDLKADGAREQLAEDFGRVTRGLDKVLENRPARAISLGGEEAL